MERHVNVPPFTLAWRQAGPQNFLSGSASTPSLEAVGRAIHGSKKPTLTLMEQSLSPPEDAGNSVDRALSWILSTSICNDLRATTPRFSRVSLTAVSPGPSKGPSRWALR